MSKLISFHLKLSERQVRQLNKLSAKLELDRTSLIRLAIARLVEEETKRSAPATPKAAETNKEPRRRG